MSEMLSVQKLKKSVALAGMLATTLLSTASQASWLNQAEALAVFDAVGIVVDETNFEKPVVIKGDESNGVASCKNKINSVLTAIFNSDTLKIREGEPTPVDLEIKGGYYRLLIVLSEDFKRIKQVDVQTTQRKKTLGGTIKKPKVVYSDEVVTSVLCKAK